MKSWARKGREQLSRTTTKDDLVFPRSIFRPTRTRESTPANANNSVLAKNPWRSWIFWALPKSAGIFTSEDESDAKSLTLKLASNQLQTSSSNWCQGSHNKLKGTMIRVLVENNFDRDNVCHMAIKVFRSTFATAMCKCTITTLLDDSNLNVFPTFWPRLKILGQIAICGSFSHAPKKFIYTCSAPPPPPPYKVGHVYTLFLQSFNIVLGGGRGSNAF